MNKKEIHLILCEGLGISDSLLAILPIHILVQMIKLSVSCAFTFMQIVFIVSHSDYNIA